MKIAVADRPQCIYVSTNILTIFCLLPDMDGMLYFSFCIFLILRGMDTFSEVTLSNGSCILSKKEFTLKEKNLLPKGANSYLLE